MSGMLLEKMIKTSGLGGPDSDKLPLRYRTGHSPEDFKDIVIYNVYDELGSTGTKIFAGVLSEEYLNEWQNLDRRCQLIYRMLRSDATVKAVFKVCTLPIESADFRVRPPAGSTDPMDAEIAKDVEENLFTGMSATWSDTIRQILACLPYGFSVFELVWGRNEDGKVYLRKLAPRLQRTVSKWRTDKNGGLAGVEQRAYFVRGDQTYVKTVVIPVEKLVVFSYDQEGSDFEGSSMLRASYKH